jgi:hypothetical protein
MAYERGTPQGPLSRTARWTIFVLLALVSTALGTLAAWNDERIAGLIAWTFIGSLSVLFPLISNDWCFVPLILVDLLVSSMTFDLAEDTVVHVD